LELAHRIGLQLEEASLQDLIILSIQSYTDINSLLYDVDLVQLVLEHYLSQELCQSAPAIYPMQSHDDHNTPSKLLHVAKLIDGYLVEIAKDPNLPLLKFVQIAEPIPDFARPVHDGLYLAIDTYLKVSDGAGVQIWFESFNCWVVLTTAVESQPPTYLPSCAHLHNNFFDHLNRV
jgi:hypothetical protein